jgi:hypothetical protein
MYFNKCDRASFEYWFAHWCAFNMTALNLRCWKFKYLFHDFEKPWLKLFMSYESLQKFHRKHNRHHLEYKNPNKIDWEAMVIDWECSRFTKINCPRNAKDEMIFKLNNNPKLVSLVLLNMVPILKKLKLA